MVDHVPKLAADATPSKFDRFVYDEVGVFDPQVREKLQRTAFQFAAAANVEIVTILAKGLQGREPDEYALDVMRQLRVGKLDVGNGAVLVVSPGSKQVGVALGAGLLVNTIAPLGDGVHYRIVVNEAVDLGRTRQDALTLEELCQATARVVGYYQHLDI